MRGKLLTSAASLTGLALLVGCGLQIPDLDETQQMLDRNQQALTRYNQRTANPNNVQPTAEGDVPKGPIITAASGQADRLDLRYDRSTEMTIRGPVLGKKFIRLDEDSTAEIVELQPGGDFIDVMLGTTKFMYHHDIELGIADQIMVTGSRITVNDRPMLLAREVTFGSSVYRLRYEDGWPRWVERPDSDADDVGHNEIDVDD